MVAPYLITARRSQFRHCLERCIGVTLDLDDGDGATRKAPVRVEYRIVTVLPGLVHQAASLAAGVIEKSRGAAVQPPLDPIGRREQTGPDPIDERPSAGAH